MSYEEADFSWSCACAMQLYLLYYLLYYRLYHYYYFTTTTSSPTWCLKLSGSPSCSPHHMRSISPISSEEDTCHMRRRIHVI